METQKALIVVNPNARGGQLGERWKWLEPEVMAALGDIPASVSFTTAEDHGERCVRDALRSGVKNIVVLGGDGTVSDAVQGFFEPGAEGMGVRPIAPDASLCVLPSGRGDDFFKTVIGKKARRSEQAWQWGLELLRKGKALPSDVGCVEFETADGKKSARFFINIASFGYPGLVVKRIADRRVGIGTQWLKRSSLTYFFESVLSLKDYKPLQVAVRANGKEIFEGSLFSGFVLNGRYNGGGMCWHRDARIDDGLFHVSLFKPRSFMESLLTSPRMKSGDWSGLKSVMQVAARTMEVEWKNPLCTHPRFEIDGELPEPPRTLKARFRILPSALRIVRTG